MDSEQVAVALEKAAADIRTGAKMHNGAGIMQGILQQLIQQLGPMLLPLIQQWIQQALKQFIEQLGKTPPPVLGPPVAPAPPAGSGW